MTATTRPQAETSWRQALADFTDQAHKLIGPTYGTVNRDHTGIRIVTGPSILDQLQNALAGDEDGQPGDRRGARIPLRADIGQLLMDVGSGIRGWYQHNPRYYGLVIPNPHRHNNRTIRDAHAIVGYLTNPHARLAAEDGPFLQRAADEIAGWLTRADQILNPPRRMDIAAPCPACDRRWYYHHDGADEIRSAALTVTANGCSCQACGTTWGPELFQHLARVLECPLPEGVLV